jgi:hypothetical protein
MRSIPREEVPVVIDDNGVELRVRDEEGLSVGFVRLPAGADLRPATKGLPDDLCPCPHWGYMIKGRVRMHTPGGHQDFAAGEAFYWAPGHAPEALEDSEYVDFSPTDEFRRVRGTEHRERHPLGGETERGIGWSGAACARVRVTPKSCCSAIRDRAGSPSFQQPQRADLPPSRVPLRESFQRSRCVLALWRCGEMGA